MRNLSVTTFIHILFSVAISILVATFLLFLSWDRDRQKIEEFKHYQLISITFLSELKTEPDEETLEKLYRELKVVPLTEEAKGLVKAKIEEKGRTIFSGGSALGQVSIYDIEGLRYVYVQHMKYNLMLKDNRGKNYFFDMAIGIGIFLIVLLFILYFAVLRKLYPLKTLHAQIEEFAQGNIKTRISYKYDDEIGKIAQNFDGAIRHINELTASKNLFMRNMMHELKTPITKGRIVVEMLEDENSKKLLVSAFERMNELISELAQIERVTTQSFEPNLEEISIYQVVHRTQTLLLDDSSSVTIEVQNRIFISDLKLLSLALKNLLDNGIKYSRDKHVILRSDGNRLEVYSLGDELDYPLSYYIEPFSQEQKRSSGFGLGLYIVQMILHRLNYVLGYRYARGYNVFMIEIEESCPLHGGKEHKKYPLTLVPQQ
ncbi:MAG TPA: HAMP domain-containing histidine kinase [Epsilonproteobacteria bacterium]|nr:HAMP domain-containing histidine kinase [Campylobacterota bacterium]